MLYAELGGTQTLGFDSKSRHLTLYQRKVISEELIMDNYRTAVEVI